VDELLAGGRRRGSRLEFSGRRGSESRAAREKKPSSLLVAVEQGTRPWGELARRPLQGVELAPVEQGRRSAAGLVAVDSRGRRHGWSRGTRAHGEASTRRGTAGEKGSSAMDAGGARLGREQGEGAGFHGEEGRPTMGGR
jgi:hypothetical protein